MARHRILHASLDELARALRNPDDILEAVQHPVVVDGLVFYSEGPLERIKLIEKAAESEYFPLDLWLGEVLGRPCVGIEWK